MFLNMFLNMCPEVYFLTSSSLNPLISGEIHHMEACL